MKAVDETGLPRLRSLQKHNASYQARGVWGSRDRAFKNPGKH
ncbi:MAG: hypothetical protein AAGH67_17350 [Cyanobacteria bacterium P01_H01_bin.162]